MLNGLVLIQIAGMNGYSKCLG